MFLVEGNFANKLPKYPWRYANFREKSGPLRPDTIVFEIFMWSTVEEYAILAPTRLPGLFETPDFLKTAFVASGYHRLWAIQLVSGWGTNAACALQIPSSLSDSCGLRSRSIDIDPNMIPGDTFRISAALRRLPRIASALLYTQTPDQPPKRPLC